VGSSAVSVKLLMGCSNEMAVHSLWIVMLDGREEAGEGRSGGRGGRGGFSVANRDMRS
jgi:hypothetical protein